MTFIDFLHIFIMLLLTASNCIVGFYIITRGTLEEQADGTWKRTGKILKDWSLFWEKTTGSSKIFFNTETTRDKLFLLRAWNPGLGNKLHMHADPKEACLDILETISSSDIQYMRENLQCEVLIDEMYLFLYVNMPQYRFPEWVRFPLSQCPPCMASIGGSLIYWPAMWMNMPGIWAWTSFPLVSSLFFWVIFCCALAAINKGLYRILGAA
jgi:hypothetical protein